MLKKIKQIFLSLACMIILLHAVIPHHHHNNTTTLCLQQLSHNACNDNYDCTSHHDHDNGCDNSDCTIDDLYAPKENLKLTQTLTQTLTLILAQTYDFDFVIKEKGKDFRRSEQTIIYKNPLAINNIGLRAPPVNS